MKKSRIVYSVILALILIGCQDSETIVLDNDLIIEANATLTQVILEDGFSPPVASRIYAYSNVAAYHVITMLHNNIDELSSQLTEFEQPKIETSQEKLIPEFAATVAFCLTARELVYRPFIIDNFLQEKKDSISSLASTKTVAESIVYGEKVAEAIMNWASEDNYSETRKMPLYTPNSTDSSWQTTSPSYGEAAEPHWFKLRPLLLNSTNQFNTIFPVRFSKDEDSEFYDAAMLVKETVDNVSQEQIEIAKFWDCNPQMTQTSGHSMVKVRQITPGGHWIGITSIASKKRNLSFEEASYIHALVSIGLYDGFLSAWSAKYQNDLIRPETYIKNYIDKEYNPLLETPLFPEYPSAHSVISGVSSTILESYFGENFEYEDDVEDPYGLPRRSFKSFHDAAEEASISRVYGGIHYKFGVDDGLEQGRKIGDFMIDKLKLN